jgi:hypothetical protein
MATTSIKKRSRFLDDNSPVRPRKLPAPKVRHLSAVIQDTLRLRRAARLKREFKAVQGYWSRKAMERGILSEDDLRRYTEE